MAGDVGPGEDTQADWDDWELDDELDDAARMIQRVRASGAGAMPLAAALAPSASTSTRGATAWTLALLGTMTLVCGGVLVIWSLAAARTQLWNVGVPLALVGQAALLASLVVRPPSS